MPGKDYYNILGVNRNATDRELKQAYRRLARKYHPDVNPGDKSAEARFKQINEAFETLSDPEKRQKYDQFGDNWQVAEQFSGAGQGAPGGSPRGGTYTTFDFGGLGDLGNIFENMGFGTGTSTARRPGRPKSVQHTIDVTLEEAYQGTTRMLQLQGEDACPTCGGTGRSSKVRGRACPTCSGSGGFPKMKRLEVKIPPGVNDGSKIRLAGQGGIGGDGAKSDIELIVKMMPHKTFERKDDDLHTEVPVPLLTALLGGEVELPTLKGKVALKIPPETPNGNVFRLAGKGMPHLGNLAQHGDLFAKMKVVLPTNLTPKEKQLLEQLQAIRPN